MTRVTPQAAADLIGLIRIMADPDRAKAHMDDLAAEHADIDARQADLDQREKDISAAKAVLAGVAQANDTRQRALSEREVALNNQAADIELRVRNHGVDVAKFQAEMEAFKTIRASAQSDLDAQGIDLKKREDAVQKDEELLDARRTAVNVREAEVQQAAEAHDERVRKFKAALAE